MKVIQSYQQGTKHSARNQPCEDRTYYLSKNDVNVIALADGAGNQKYTHAAIGAECVTETICKFFCNNFDAFYEKENIEELKSVIVAVCRKKLSELADKLELDSIMRLSSTLLAVAIKNDKVIVCHIGDGVIGKLTPHGTETVSNPSNGEYISTTYFITSADAEKHINIKKETLDDICSYFLMSDGMSEYLYNDTEHSFYDGARKLALFTNQENGENKLKKAIKDFIIDQDPVSDDCSFICLSMSDSIYVPKSDTHQTEKTESETNGKKIHSQKSSDSSDSQTVIARLRNVLSEKGTPKKLIILIVAIIIVILSVIGFLGRKSNEADNNTSKPYSYSDSAEKTEKGKTEKEKTEKEKTEKEKTEKEKTEKEKTEKEKTEKEKTEKEKTEKEKTEKVKNEKEKNKKETPKNEITKKIS